MNLTDNPPSPTLAGFAAWLETFAKHLAADASRSTTAGDTSRGLQLSNLAAVLPPLAIACRAYAAGQEPVMEIRPAATTLDKLNQAASVREIASRFRSDLAELSAADAGLEAELKAISARVAAHAAAKDRAILRMTAELKALGIGRQD